MADLGSILARVETIHVASAVVAVITIFIAWSTWATYNHFFTKPKRLLKLLRKQGIPGMPFRPFVGQLPELIEVRKKRERDPAYAASTHAVQWAFDYTHEFGNLWTFCMGPFPRVVVLDPTIIRAAYTTYNDSFIKSAALRSMKILGDGLLTASGSLWSWERRIINPAFSHKEIKRIYPTMVRCSEEALGKLEGQVKECRKEAIWNIDPIFSHLTLDIVCRSAFGSQLEALFEDGLLKELSSTFAEYLNSTGRAIQYNVILPFFSYLPFKVNRSVWRTQNVIRTVMKKIISVRLARHKELSLGKEAQGANGATNGGHLDGEDRTDLLELMMNSTEGLGDSGSPNLDRTLTPELLMDNCLTFLLAGHETTSQLLTWTILLLSQHPEWQEKAREEVNALFEANGGKTPSFDQLSELKLLGCVVNESLRLYPPAVVIGRTCARTTKLSDSLTVPKGVDLMVPILAIHRSRELWGEDADKFRPERFAGGISKAATNPHAFMPFSIGPRTCIGQNFAIAEGKIILALFLRKFAWRVADTYKHFPEMAITQRPRHGVPVHLEALG